MSLLKIPGLVLSLCLEHHEVLEGFRRLKRKLFGTSVVHRNQTETLPTLE